MKEKKLVAKKVTLDVIFDILCGIMFALGLNCFTSPNDIAPGGVSGIAVIMNHVFHIPMGVTIFGINIPLLILAWIYIGHGFTLCTLKTIFLQSMVVDLLAPYLPAYRGDHLLATLFGGVCIGFGVSLVFRRGSTTGGTDVISRLIQRRYPYMQIGVVMVGVDALVVVASMLVFRNIETGLYSLIAIFVSGRVIDMVMGGLNMGRLILIISEKYEEISRDIMDQMQRGVTLLQANGAYSGKERKVVLCAVRISEYPRVQQIVKEHDPHAFLITTNVNEVLGEGFTALDAERMT